MSSRRRAAPPQVEFGAHQVILVRSMAAVDQLPEEIRDSNAIIMTVPQAKGLEFDDVSAVRRAPYRPMQLGAGLKWLSDDVT